MITSTYVNGPIALLHVVGGEEVGDTGELVEQVVLETEQGSRANNRSFRVDLTSNLLTQSLFIQFSICRMRN
jgi:hypothetical protein